MNSIQQTNTTKPKYSVYSRIKSINEDTDEVLGDQLVEISRVHSYESGLRDREELHFDTYKHHVGFDDSGPVYEERSCLRKPIHACRFDENGAMIRTRESFHLSETKVRDTKKFLRLKTKNVLTEGD